MRNFIQFWKVESKKYLIYIFCVVLVFLLGLYVYRIDWNIISTIATALGAYFMWSSVSEMKRQYDQNQLDKEEERENKTQYLIHEFINFMKIFPYDSPKTQFKLVPFSDLPLYGKNLTKFEEIEPFLKYFDDLVYEIKKLNFLINKNSQYKERAESLIYLSIKIRDSLYELFENSSTDHNVPYINLNPSNSVGITKPINDVYAKDVILIWSQISQDMSVIHFSKDKENIFTVYDKEMGHSMERCLFYHTQQLEAQREILTFWDDQNGCSSEKSLKDKIHDAFMNLDRENKMNAPLEKIVPTMILILSKWDTKELTIEKIQKLFEDNLV